MTPQLKKAFDHVKEHHPTLSIVIFDKNGAWQYMDENFESFKFNNMIDVSILEEAADSIIKVPFIYQE